MADTYYVMYGILAGNRVTANSGSTKILGDLGSNLSVNGIGTVVASAQTNIGSSINKALTNAQNNYITFNSCPPTTIISTADIGGSTFTPGVTQFTNTGITIGANPGNNTITLNGHGVYFFQVSNGGLTTQTILAPVSFNLTNGAKPSQIYWLINGSLTLDASTYFLGSVICQGNIILGTNCTTIGSLCTPGGNITLNNNKITSTGFQQSLDVIQPSPGFGNVARVDQVYGGNATALIDGAPFLTINNAITAITTSSRAFVTIWVMPGTYNEVLVLPANITLRGLSRSTVFIQKLGVTSSTDLITMGDNTRVEDVTLTLTSSGHYTLRGVVFPAATTTNSQLSTVIVNVNNSTASPTGTSNIYGIHSTGTGTSFEDRHSCQNVILEVDSIGAGNKRGLLVDASNTFNTQNSNFLVNGTGPTGSYIGVETNHASAIANIQSGTVRGYSSDISQTLGSLTVGAISLPNSTANSLGFDTTFRSPGIIWADSGALPAETSFYRVGTAAVTATLLGPIRIGHKCIVKLLTIAARVAPGDTDTWTVFKNGVATALTASMTTPTLFAQNTIVSVTFDLGDTIGIQVVRGTAGASDTVVQVELY